MAGPLAAPDPGPPQKANRAPHGGPDGSPQVTPLWVAYDGTYVTVNSAVGRQKDRNIRARPSVAICIIDPDDPARYLAVRGPVVEVTEEGAVEHARQLTQRYTGRTTYTVPAGVRRVIYKIRPERVSAHG